MDPCQTFIAACGVSVSVLRDGDPLLFLHGANGLNGWSRFLDRLSDSFDVIAPEHPGFGDSDDPEWICSIADVAALYVKLLDELDLAKVHVVGTSLGGWIAAELALLDSRRISTLALLCPAGLSIENRPVAKVFEWSRAEAVRNLVFDQALATSMLSTPASEKDIEVAVKNRTTAKKLIERPCPPELALERRLSQLTMPVKLFWGSDDKIIPPEYAARWKDLIPDASLSMFERCGHVPHIEYARGVSQEIQAFIQQHPT